MISLNAQLYLFPLRIPLADYTADSTLKTMAQPASRLEVVGDWETVRTQGNPVSTQSQTPHILATSSSHRVVQRPATSQSQLLLTPWLQPRPAI